MKRGNLMELQPTSIEVELFDVLNTAWAVVRTNGTRYDGRDEAARNAVAKHIVDLALQGERDRQRLIESAIAQFKH
jgi:hypothetical protein